MQVRVVELCTEVAVSVHLPVVPAPVTSLLPPLPTRYTDIWPSDPTIKLVPLMVMAVPAAVTSVTVCWAAGVKASVVPAGKAQPKQQ